MISLKSFFAILITFCVSMSIHAEVFIYGGAEWIQGSFIGPRHEGSVGVLIGRAGIEYKNVALETRHGTGILLKEVKSSSNQYEIGPESLSGLYSIFRMRSDVGLTPYGVVGVSKVEATVIKNSSKTTVTETGLSFGFGMDFLMTKHTVGSFEYISYVDKGDVNFGGIGLGAMYAF